MKSRKFLILSLLILPFILSACGSKKAEVAPVVEAATVKGQKVADSLSIKRELS